MHNFDDGQFDFADCKAGSAVPKNALYAGKLVVAVAEVGGRKYIGACKVHKRKLGNCVVVDDSGAVKEDPTYKVFIKTSWPGHWEKSKVGGYNETFALKVLHDKKFTYFCKASIKGNTYGGSC